MVILVPRPAVANAVLVHPEGEDEVGVVGLYRRRSCVLMEPVWRGIVVIGLQVVETSALPSQS